MFYISNDIHYYQKKYQNNIIMLIVEENMVLQVYKYIWNHASKSGKQSNHIFHPNKEDLYLNHQLDSNR